MAQVLLTDTDRVGMSLALERQLQAADLTIVCKEGRVVRAHQAVFAWGSSWLRRVFMSQFLLEDGGKRKEEVTLHLPGFSVHTVTAVTRFLTCGELRIALSTAGRQEIEEAWEDLKINRITFKDAFDAGKEARGRRTIASFTGSVGKSISQTPQTPGKTLSRAGRPPINKMAVKTPGKPGAGFPPGPPLSSPSPFPARTRSTRTPGRPAATPAKPSSRASVPSKLVGNAELSVTVTSRVNSDDDDLMIVEEIRKPSDSIPKGISITKSDVKNEKSDSIEASTPRLKGESDSKLSSTPKLRTDIKSKKTVENSQTKKKVQLKTEDKYVNKYQSAQRRTSSRLRSVSLPSYKEDDIQPEGKDKASDDKENIKSVFPVTAEERTKILNKTKKLRIPLRNLSDSDKGFASKNRKTTEISITKVQTADTEKTQKVEVTITKNPQSSAELPTLKAVTITKNPPKTVESPNQSAVKAKITRNPANCAPAQPVVQQATVQTVVKDNKEITITKAVTTPSTASEVADPEAVACYVCSETMDKGNKKQLTLNNLAILRTHISKCLYDSGKLAASIPPINGDKNGKAIDELTALYNCEVDGCWLAGKKGNQGKLGYKAFAIHMASQHGKYIIRS